jgi:enoyl-CoA hydratase/carnithine racemase
VKYIVSDRVGEVKLLTVDRPPANAMDVGLLSELVQAIDGICSDPPRALVLAGREGFFSGGADLKAVPGYGPEQQREMVHGINRMAIGVYSLPCPVVAAITGHAIAGGMVLALCADYRVASIEGRYGLTEVKVGVPYPQAAMMAVQAELPPHATRRLAFTNRLVDAEECVRLGAFDEALAPEAVVDRAIEVAAELAPFPDGEYARAKRGLRGETIKRMKAGAETDPLLDAWVS